MEFVKAPALFGFPSLKKNSMESYYRDPRFSYSPNRTVYVPRMPVGNPRDYYVPPPRVQSGQGSRYQPVQNSPGNYAPFYGPESVNVSGMNNQRLYHRRSSFCSTAPFPNAPFSYSGQTFMTGPPVRPLMETPMPPYPFQNGIPHFQPPAPVYQHDGSAFPMRSPNYAPTYRANYNAAPMPYPSMDPLWSYPSKQPGEMGFNTDPYLQTSTQKIDFENVRESSNSPLLPKHEDTFSDLELDDISDLLGGHLADEVFESPTQQIPPSPTNSGVSMTQRVRSRSFTATHSDSTRQRYGHRVNTSFSFGERLADFSIEGLQGSMDLLRNECGYCRSIGKNFNGHTKNDCGELIDMAPCPRCGASGEDNHTEMYCPVKVHLELKPEMQAILDVIIARRAEAKRALGGDLQLETDYNDWAESAIN